jgi:MtfA peptidase
MRPRVPFQEDDECGVAKSTPSRRPVAVQRTVHVERPPPHEACSRQPRSGLRRWRAALCERLQLSSGAWCAPTYNVGKVLRMVSGFLTRRRRSKLRAQPVPPAWRAIVERNVPIFKRLPREDQAELLGHVQVFLAEKHFEGCGGLELTDEIRVTIAAQACLLLLHRETDYYPRLRSILVYPTGYTAYGERYVGGGVWEEAGDDRLGHTQQQLRALVLAWDSAKHGALEPTDGENLVFHEFAHQLDFEDSSTDGTPALDTRAEYLAWARVMGEEFAALRAAEEEGRSTLIDQYGAKNPAEFFAVATEAFFERPHAIRRRHPALFEALARFYRQDPTVFLPDPPPGGGAEAAPT